MPTSETTDLVPVSAPVSRSFGELLFELRTAHAKLSPSRANAKLKQGLREHLFHAGEAMIADWERGNSLPEPLLLLIYLEVLEAPSELLAKLEAALKTATAQVTAALGNPQAAPRPAMVRTASPPSSLSWQRERVRLAAELLHWHLQAQACFERAVPAEP